MTKKISDATPAWRQPLGNTRKNTIKEIWNSEEYKKLRLALLNSEKPSACTQCWKHEEAGIESNRIAKNNRFKKHISIKDETNFDGSLDIMKLLYLSITLTYYFIHMFIK